MGEKIRSLINKYPQIFLTNGRAPSCGVGCGDGWYDILDTACGLLNYRIANPSWVPEYPRLSRFMVSTHNLLCTLKLGGKWSLKVSQYFCEYVPPKETLNVKVKQVKEKFGELRLYISGGDQWCSGVIAMAEALSRHTCEYCGQPGKRRDGGWIKTLCDNCCQS